MANLNTLSNELLDEITAYVNQGNYRDRRDDLYSLALVCRKTKPSAYEALYKSYINLDDEGSFSQFLSTVVDRPDLAEKVKYVSVRGWKKEGASFVRDLEAIPKLQQYGPYESRIIPTDDRIKRAEIKYLNKPRNKALFYRLLKVLQAKHLLPHGDWKDHVEHLHFYRGLPPGYDADQIRRHELVKNLWDEAEDGHLLLILCLLPNVTTLKVKVSLPEWPTVDWDFFLGQGTRILQHLETLYVHNEGGQDRLHPLLGYALNATTLLTDISLKHVWLPNITPFPAPGAKPVEKLELFEMSVPLSFIHQKTMQGCIDDFTLVDQGVKFPSVHAIQPLAAADIVRSLYPSQASLLHLHLHIGPRRLQGQTSMSLLVSEPTASIVHFSHLISLHLDIWTLFRLSGHYLERTTNPATTDHALQRINIAQVLFAQIPHSLVFLRLKDVNHGIFRVLVEIVNLKKLGYYPKLETVEVEMSSGCGRGAEARWAQAPYRRAAFTCEAHVSVDAKEVGVDMWFRFCEH
jgi:hypothetical protein